MPHSTAWAVVKLGSGTPSHSPAQGSMCAVHTLQRPLGAQTPAGWGPGWRPEGIPSRKTLPWMWSCVGGVLPSSRALRVQLPGQATNPRGNAALDAGAELASSQRWGLDPGTHHRQWCCRPSQAFLECLGLARMGALQGHFQNVKLLGKQWAGWDLVRGHRSTG